MSNGILVPSDGFALAGGAFAASCDAEVVGLYAAPEDRYPVSIEQRLPGSITSKVLSLCDFPVLAYRKGMEQR